jgi:hypothetical protein
MKDMGVTKENVSIAKDMAKRFRFCYDNDRKIHRIAVHRIDQYKGDPERFADWLVRLVTKARLLADTC